MADGLKPILLIDATSEKATIDSKDVAGNKAGGFGGEEDGGASEFIELAEAAHRCSQQEFATALGAVEKAGVQFCAEDARSDGVHAHSVRGPFDGKGFGQRGDGSFAGRVRGNFVEGHEGGKGRNINDTTVFALDHVTAEDPGGAESAGEICVHDGVPFEFGEIHGGHALGAAGAVDQDLDFTEFAKDGLGELLDAAGFGYIAGVGQGAAAELGYLGGCVFDVVGTAAGGDHIGASLG